MVTLQHAPEPQNSSLLTLPAEVRNQIWRLLFKDSKVVYKKCFFNQALSTERYQIVHTCRSAYQETFDLLWSHTVMNYIDCIPAPNSAGLKEQFAVSAPCRKLIPRLEIDCDLTATGEWPPRYRFSYLDLRGLRYFAPLREVWIRPFSTSAQFTVDDDIDQAGAEEALLLAIYETLCDWLGDDVANMLKRRNRKYRAFIRLIVYDFKKEWVGFIASIEG